MSKRTYVNRHGKSVSVDDDNIVVASTPPVEAPVVTTAKERTFDVPKRKWSFSRPQVSARTVRMTAVLCIIALAAGIFMLQVGSSRYASAAHTMEQRLAAIKKQAAKADTPLTTTVQSLRQALPEASCPTSYINFSLTTQAKDTKKRCEDVEARYNSVRNQLEKVSVLSVYTAGLEKAMGDALVNPADGSFAVVSTYDNRWRDAVKALSTLQSPSFVRTEHDELVKSATNVSDVWTRLAKADADHNAEGYDKAAADLSLAYEAFRGSSDQILARSLSIQKSLLVSLR